MKKVIPVRKERLIPVDDRQQKQKAWFTMGGTNGGVFQVLKSRIRALIR